MATRVDPYGSMARHYDLHGWDWYAPTNGARLLALLAERGVRPGASILDVGCGTGTVALLLAGAGYRVTGVDVSAAMLERAAAKDAGGAVTWKEADARSLSLGTTFDAIVTVADALNHLETLEEWGAAFASCHAHLRPGGILFADVMTCEGLAQMDVQSVQERGGVMLICAIVWDPGARRSTLKITSFVPDPAHPARYERVQQTIVERGHAVADILARAKAAGFAGVERIWTSASDAETEQRLTLLATR